MARSGGEGLLYDFLREKFGIGDYDDELSKVPYYKYRMTEVGKLKRLLKSRNCTVDEVRLAAEYAIERGMPITQAWQLTALAPEAVKAQRKAERSAPTDVRVRLEEAAREAHEQGNTGWMQRLFTADDANGEEVLAAWMKEKTHE